MDLFLLAFVSFGATGVIGALIQLCVLVLVLIVAFWVIGLLLSACGVAIPANIWLIVRIIVVLIVLLYALRVFGIA